MFFNTRNLDSIEQYLDDLNNFIKSDRHHIDKLDENAKGTLANIHMKINTFQENLEDTSKQDLGVYGEIMLTCEKMGDGYFSDRIALTTDNPKVNYIAKTVNVLSDRLENAIGIDLNEIDKVLEAYSQYDFRPKIENSSGKLDKAVDFLGDVITQMLVENKKNGLTLGSFSDRLIENVETLNTSVSQQAASLEETAASIEEITSTINQSSEKANTMTTLADATKQSATTGKSLANQTANAMQEINAQTTAIADAITVIDQIAFQTNILSLNAAVEAATAGEAGKGFAVVAGEVRNLAARSAEAASEIKALVSSAKNKADEGKTISTQMISGYEELESNIAQTAELITDAAAAANEQLSAINQINDAVAQLDQATQENSRMADETNQIAVDIDTVAKRVVSDADAKEFHGKDNIDISADIKTSTVKAQPKAVNNEAINNEAVNNKAVKVAPKVTKKANSNDDEWDSF